MKKVSTSGIGGVDCVELAGGRECADGGSCVLPSAGWPLVTTQPLPLRCKKYCIVIPVAPPFLT